MNDPRSDAIAAFYDEHPYPPPVDDLDRLAAGGRAVRHRARVDHHRVWPWRAPATVRRVLVAGCGTSQAARHALRAPNAEVVGIDVSATSIAHTERLIEQHRIENLRIERRPIEEVATLGTEFDHIVCTGVLHHLADPAAGLRALASVLAADGAITLMIYARYGRVGVEMIQAYCRLLGVEPSDADVGDLVSALRELPRAHPMSRLLRDTHDFRHADALADALLNPRERSYAVDDVVDLLGEAGLAFGRWARQAPYLAECGAVGATPHGARLRDLDPQREHAAMELYRGTMDRHTVIAFASGEHAAAAAGIANVNDAVPVLDPGAVAVDDPDRLPPGAAAALLNREHTTPDVVLFANRSELAWFRSIDGRRSTAELGIEPEFVRRLWRRDLVVLDTTGRRSADSRTP